MAGKTFVEKILGAPAGSIVFASPDLVLSHDNTSSIAKIFAKMGGSELFDPRQLMVVLDHNAPPTNSKLANDYQAIRDFVKTHSITRFYDAGEGICHQLMANHARPGMLIVGSDSHTCTAGAFNALAAGIDRTETAGLWKNGETWFRVPETLKIVMNGLLREHVHAKDLALYIIGKISSSGANYLAIEFHGDGVASLSVSERMTLSNLASEMGAKCAAFPADDVLEAYLNEPLLGTWADEDATYCDELFIELEDLFPVAACPHHVDNIKSIDDLKETPIHQALIGTCTNGRIEDLRLAAGVLKGRQVRHGVQLLITPASRQIYLQAMKEGLIETFLLAGANVLSPSCGPCLGTGQGIPADNMNVISTANRNFPGRMGNKKANIYLASPETVALSALNGKITSPLREEMQHHYPFPKKHQETIEITSADNRYHQHVWAYPEVNNLNTDQMFAGKLTYEINSSEPEKIIPYLFTDFDKHFAPQVQRGDIVIAGENFGCGSSREHPAVGLAYVGVKAVIVKSVNRIFYRSSINQGLPIIVLPAAVDAYQIGDKVCIDFEKGMVSIDNLTFNFSPLPDKLLQILMGGGLVNWIAQTKSAGMV